MFVLDMAEPMRLPVLIIERYALEFNVNHKLLHALILMESGGNRYAVQFQPGYRHLYQPYEFAKKLSITYVTEKVFQQSSHGYVQIMGGTARSLGFKGYPVQLYEPDTNIRLGAKFLGLLKKQYSSESDIISAYNQGQPFKRADGTYTNQAYVDKVKKLLLQLEVWY